MNALFFFTDTHSAHAAVVSYVLRDASCPPGTTWTA